MRQLSAARIEKLKHMSEGSALDETSGVPEDEAPLILEAMFLMSAVDGDVSAEEVEQFAGAIEPLLGDVTEADVEGLLSEMSGALEDEGWEQRSRKIAKGLRTKRARETAFRLATAVAFVDDSVAEAESSALDALALSFDISSERVHEIMSEVHRELFG
jgi:hypothetical protein